MEGIKVFISSTMDDLRGERDAAAEAIKELCLTPIRAEDFGPARRSPRDEYREKVEDSDIYVGILAKRDSQDVRD